MQPSPESLIHIPLSLLRLPLVCIIFFCNVQDRKYTATYFDRDLDFGVAMIALGLTNGYLVTLASTNACKSVYGIVGGL